MKPTDMPRSACNSFTTWPAFRENSAHPTVPRVAPFERVSRSDLAGEVHNAFSNAEAVDWTQPAADPLPVLELPVIHRVSLDAAPATG